MSAIFKFLKLLLLGTLALVLAGAVIGVGYWQYARQAELFDGFEYMAWDSHYQRQIIDTIQDGEGREFKVMMLARRYDDHWVQAYLYPDDFVTDDGESRAGYLGMRFFWDADCTEGTKIDTGVPLGDGTAELKCIDGDKLRFDVTYGDPDEDLWSDMPDHVFQLGGYSADTGLVQYWPWEEARRFQTLQKATKSSESD